MNKKWLIIGAIVVILLIWVGYSYNSLIRLDQNVKGKWADVQGTYQRRADLIPNLVNTVKGAANFEQSTLTAVTEARAKATSVQIDPDNLDAESIAKFQAAQGEVTSALSRLLVSVEAYPQLTATENFRQLQSEIEGTENRIQVARRDFNAAVQNFNVRRHVFPTIVIANIFGFDDKGYFEADSGAQTAPDVNFEQ